MTRILAVLAVLIALVAPAQAHEFLLNDLQIIHPAIPATAVNATSAPIYMVLANEGTETERLLRIETELGTVTFQRPVTSDDGTTRMETLPYIDIPVGETVLLTRGEMRGVISSLTRPVFEGGLLPGVMVFEKRGRFEMFFMVDPPDEEEAQTANAPQIEQEEADRLADLLTINTVLRRELGNARETVIAPVVVHGDFAVAGWTKGESGARAVLRRDQSAGWYVELWSGKSAMLPTTLVSLGVGRAAGDALRRELKIWEALLGQAYTQRFDEFPGTVVIGKERGIVAGR